MFFPTFTVGIPTISCVGTYHYHLIGFCMRTIFNIRKSMFIPKSAIKYFGSSLLPLVGTGSAAALARKQQVHQERWSEEYIGRGILSQAVLLAVLFQDTFYVEGSLRLFKPNIELIKKIVLSQ